MDAFEWGLSSGVLDGELQMPMKAWAWCSIQHTWVGTS